MRSNLEFWQKLQNDGYFDSHPYYLGLINSNRGEIANIEAFRPLTSDMIVVVIGCGYGRETAYIAPRVNQVYGIDVNAVVLSKAVHYLAERSITNFTPVLADRYKTDIPDGVDLVFSIVVMQHLTRDLVEDYFVSLAKKLKFGGAMVIQFLEDCGDWKQIDAELKAYEPSVTWTLPELAALCRACGLVFNARSIQATDTCLWHWLYAVRSS
jgi:cyclopropane fatty-acyl-phospholipid synthase-like methyltransferase